MSKQQKRTNRRKFIIKSGYLGGFIALSPLLATACGNDSSQPADGSFTSPWSSLEPGDFDPLLEKPVAYISETSTKKKNLQLWIEILDSATGYKHPQNEQHFIQQIFISDDQNNRIFAQKYTSQHQARLIFNTLIPEEVTNIYVYRKCSQHGWWKETFIVKNKDYTPKGDLKRAYTKNSKGTFSDKSTAHLPMLYQENDQQLRIEIGSRKEGKLHPMEKNHYISEILIFDDYNQQRLAVSLSPDFNQEALIITEKFKNTKWIRIIARCNRHQWWQSIYDL